MDETIIAGSADLERHTGDSQTSDNNEELPTDIHTNNDDTNDDATDTETNGSTDTDTDTNEAETTTEDLDVQAEHQAEGEQMLRRSTRIRKKPNWFRCADYTQHTAKPDWHVRCSFLSDLITLYPNHEYDIITVILNIVSTT